jgi:environmental stress-induced protein Ves
VREIVHTRPADARRVRWKNGRGFTDELALWPLDARFERGDYDWRVSAAKVDQPGPFSPFPGYERILVITEGEGLVLTHGDGAGRAHVRKLEPYAFSGDERTNAELARGPIADFNVFTRRGRARAEVEVARLSTRTAREPAGASHVFVHALGGALVARVTGEDEGYVLTIGDSLWIREAREGDEIELRGRSEHAVALLVRIDTR